MFAPSHQPLDLWSRQAFEVALGDFLVQRGQLDALGLERARRVAGESAGRLDTVLSQLGLVSERVLAEATARLLGLEIAVVYPKEAILPERLRVKFLRRSRALPIAIDEKTLTVAIADPLDGFVVSSMGVAAKREIEIRVAISAEQAGIRLALELTNKR